VLRHVASALTGLLALPAVYYLTEAGARGLRAGHAAFTAAPAGLGWLAAASALASVLALAPRLSPSAPVVCGLPLAVLGALYATDTGTALALARTLPHLGAPPEEPPGALAGATGLYTVLGVVLTLSALRGRRRRPAPPG
jgi:hypothetical protein